MKGASLFEVCGEPGLRAGVSSTTTAKCCCYIWNDAPCLFLVKKSQSTEECAYFGCFVGV